MFIWCLRASLIHHPESSRARELVGGDRLGMQHDGGPPQRHAVSSPFTLSLLLALLFSAFPLIAIVGTIGWL